MERPENELVVTEFHNVLHASFISVFTRGQHSKNMTQTSSVIQYSSSRLPQTRLGELDSHFKVIVHPYLKYKIVATNLPGALTKHTGCLTYVY